MRRYVPAATLGLALGGFFDGILLHQILQWHHLLSLVPGVTDLRTQILWDGYFHALMYLVGVAGLVALWRHRAEIGQDTRRRLWAPLMIGFGLWHALDAVLSHWILGIHRIKVDSPQPLLWDLGWLAAFGILPALAGLFLITGRPGPGRPMGGRFAGLLALTTGAGLWAMQPPPDLPLTSVVFRQSLPEDAIRARLDQAGATLVWFDRMSGIAVVDLPRGAGWRLYGQGALLVAGAGLPAGCFAWSRA